MISSASRLDALRALRPAGPREAVTRVRREASRSTDLPLAAEAVRQLVVHGDAEARPVLLGLHRRSRRSEDGAVHAAMMAAFACVLDRDTYKAFLEHAGFVDAEVDQTLRDVAARVAADEAFRQWLLDKGLSARSARERAVVIRLLAHVTAGDEGEQVTRGLLPLITAADRTVARTAIRCLGERRDQAAVAPLRKLMAQGRAGRRPDAMLGLHLLLRDDPDWHTELLSLLEARDAEMRTLAMDLLADLGEPRALATVHRDLDHASWPVRAAAYDFCRRVRHTSSIPRLIARVDREKGRLAEDVLDALEALTRRRFWTGERWRRWWQEEAEGFRLPPPPDEQANSARRSSGATTATYYNLPVTSKRCVFVLDTSGSMSLPYGTARKTRLEEAKRQLRQVVDQAAADFHFNVVLFETRVRPIWKKLKRASDKARDQARDAIEDCQARGGTNIHDALREAFEDPDVDTIYLLSDGYPSAGVVRDPEALADEVGRWNRTRRIRIHTIAVGSSSPLLERLAAESLARHVQVR